MKVEVSTAVAPNSGRLGDDKASYDNIRGFLGFRISALWSELVEQPDATHGGL